MKKALEILKKRKLTLKLIKASSTLTKKDHMEIDKDIKELDEAIAELEAMKPKTCLDCKHYSQSTFYGDLKVVKYCHENRLGIGDINFKIFCCNKFEPKDNA